MLSEETILLIASLAAGALLIVALLDVLWPGHGRYRRTRGRYRSPRTGRYRPLRGEERRAQVSPGVSVTRERSASPPAGLRPDTPWPGTAARRPGPGPDTMPATAHPAEPLTQEEAAVLGGRPRPGGDPALAEGPATGRPAPVVPAGDAAQAVPAAVPAAAPSKAEEDPIPFEKCFDLYQSRRYADVIAVAAPALDGQADDQASGGRPAHELAALWSIVGLSRQALDDEDGARAAFEEAIHAAPEGERPTYQRHLAALAGTAGRKLIAKVETLPDAAGEERITTLRNAVLWLRQGLACVPDDQEIRQALGRSLKGLWVSYGQLATALIQRQEFHGARRLIREVLADEDCPDDRRDVFRDLLAATFSGEIGQLTAHAIRTMQDEHEREALTSLERAERLLSSIPDEALSPKRREEVNRRLWWGYTKLGVRRVESGAYEDALDPLFHALRFDEIDAERQQETRTALVRALEGVTEARVGSIDRLLKTGNRDAAAQEGDRLRTLLRQGMAVGLSTQDLTSALTSSRRVLGQVESRS